MIIQLKNIKVMEQLSEETRCYTASVYLDGKRIGQVSNRGHGGCDEYDFHRDLAARMDEFLKKTVRPESYVHAGATIEIEYDFEQFCSSIVSKYLRAKDFRKACRANFLVLATPDGEKRGVYQFRKRPADKELIKRGDTRLLTDQIRGWIGDDRAIVLNLVDDGLEQYVKTVGR